ncbi:unnamed protein product [Auanema sp. JU1783]|nr:unnamed protein product [Auanema sp. JU1783]
MSNDDSKIGLNRDVGGPVNETTSGVSRRRMAFRPPTAPTKLGTDTVNTTTSDPIVPAPIMSLISSEDTSSAKVPLKKGKMWSHDEIMIYYEAVKQLGKDFDNITKWVAKRKVHKCKDQIKNFYFNSIKFIRTFADLDVDSQFTGVCRDAKELFLVINACEWRKRTGTSKYQADRLKELILDGVTTIRSKKKSLVIKTPLCPALNKFFIHNRRFDREKFPNDVIIKLRPKTYSEASFLIEKEKNPFLKLRLNSNERLSRLFDYLQDKWGSANGNPYESSPMEITLLPSDGMELGKIVLEVGPPETTTVSLNRLRREIDDTNSAKESGASPYSILVSNPFSINSDVVIQGLTKDNTIESSIIELYCLCGMTKELCFTYTISVPQRAPDPWQILSSLLGRDYGDTVCVGKEEDSRKRAAGDSIDEDDMSKVRITRCINCKSATAEETTPSSSRDEFTTSTAVPTVVESVIVAEENEAFEKQLQSLSGKRGRKIGGVKSSTPFSQSRITSFVSHVAKDPPPALPARRNLMQLNKDKAKGVSYASAYKYRIATEAQKKNSAYCGPTDFSHVSEPDSCNYSVLMGLKSPEKAHPVSFTSPNITRANMSEDERRRKETELFGDMSMSPSRFSTLDDKHKEYHNPSEYDLFGGDVSVTPSKTTSQMSLGVSESLQSSALFHVTVTEMMNQNSVDFSRNFLPLLDNLEQHSPKKG